jgi:hypothetical protein
VIFNYAVDTTDSLLESFRSYNEDCKKQRIYFENICAPVCSKVSIFLGIRMFCIWCIGAASPTGTSPTMLSRQGKEYRYENEGRGGFLKYFKTLAYFLLFFFFFFLSEINLSFTQKRRKAFSFCKVCRIVDR